MNTNSEYEGHERLLRIFKHMQQAQHAFLRGMVAFTTGSVLVGPMGVHNSLQNL